LCGPFPARIAAPDRADPSAASILPERSVFLGGRDNSPAMTRLLLAGAFRSPSAFATAANERKQKQILVQVQWLACGCGDRMNKFVRPFCFNHPVPS
jgi:hypothetical protein